jgi:ribosomal protein S18 acetylase RimI-like enzyme
MRPSALTIRPTTTADADAVSVVLSASYSQLFAGWYDDALLASLLPLISVAKPELLESGSYFAATRDNRILACGGWTRLDPATRSETPGTGHIRHVATHPDHLRQGIASALMRHIIADARSAGLQRLDCVSSLPAVAFYRAMGFGDDRPITVEIGPVLRLPSVFMTRSLAVGPDGFS